MQQWRNGLGDTGDSSQTGRIAHKVEDGRLGCADFQGGERGRSLLHLSGRASGFHKKTESLPTDTHFATRGIRDDLKSLDSLWLRSVNGRSGVKSDIIGMSQPMEIIIQRSYAGAPVAPSASPLIKK